MGSIAIMRYNLIQLFLQNEQSSHLRKMIVDLEVPRFDSGCQFSQEPAISYIWSEKNLNDDQRRAILKILTAKDYALILGMPGTGISCEGAVDERFFHFAYLLYILSC
ncbi:PREDICTED: DNA replication ATP-dependent helicase/nuclease DNA2-like [Nicotiana attenuata]|uniref:DNA replication ATP-dependent helicase/nuclease DNA2-like n=1 Tax=Nicotiana attenuata TaxID=49451 RepID=UPI000904A31A|nr:PREDICTED: DNA replication ATP-dependent helicase/nuclease DNA2-like [Nicotiana attenuata]